MKPRLWPFFCALSLWLWCSLGYPLQAEPGAQWKSVLPLLGHRNWIVIADAAYPWQTALGVETVAVTANQITLLNDVLTALAQSGHVRPIIYQDTELAHLTETLAPGITAHRAKLTSTLGRYEVKNLPHEEIIARLDEAGKQFKVLILKTDLRLPYTSVFLQLDCGYWSADAESQLRQLLAKHKRP